MAQLVLRLTWESRNLIDDFGVTISSVKFHQDVLKKILDLLRQDDTGSNNSLELLKKLNLALAIPLRESKFKQYLYVSLLHVVYSGRRLFTLDMANVRKEKVNLKYENERVCTVLHLSS